MAQIVFLEGEITLLPSILGVKTPFFSFLKVGFHMFILTIISLLVYLVYIELDQFN